MSKTPNLATPYFDLRDLARCAAAPALFIATAFAPALAQSAHADMDFTSYYSSSSVIDGVRYYTVDLFIHTHGECDRVLLVWDIHMSNFGYSNIFHAQAGADAPSVVPMPHDNDPHWRVDSYLGIGGSDQMESAHLTVLTPDWRDALTNGYGYEVGGYFLIPPVTQYNYAGPDRKVRIGRVTISEDEFFDAQSFEFTAKVGMTGSLGHQISTISFSPVFSLEPGGSAGNAADIPSPEPYCWIETPGSGGGDGSNGDPSGGGGSDTAPPDGVPNPNPRTFDFDGDRTPNFMWHNATSGATTIWEMEGLARIDGGPTAWTTGSWIQPIGAGDIDDDSVPEAFFWHAGARQVIVWSIVGDTRIRADAVATLGTGWTPLDVGDFTGDGRADVLMRNGSNLRVQPYANGHAYVDWSVITLPNGYTYVAGVDGDGDGKLEIMVRDAQGRHYLRRATSAGFTYYSPIATNMVANTWRLAAVGDFDGDFDDDLLWHSTDTGEVRGWALQGGFKVAAALIRTGVGPQYRVISTIDTDHDNRDEVFWRNEATGDVFGWKMNGLARESGSFIRNVALGWNIVNE